MNTRILKFIAASYLIVLLTVNFAYAEEINFEEQLGLFEVFDFSEELTNDIYKFYTYDDLGVTKEEFKILCRIVFTESNLEDDFGQQLVVHTIMNRVESNKFKNDIDSVVFRKNQFDGINLDSFGDYNMNNVSNVYEALCDRKDRLVEDWVYNIVYFHNPDGVGDSYLSDNEMVEIVTIGNHRFCKDEVN